jgi:hypothetical protein
MWLAYVDFLRTGVNCGCGEQLQQSVFTTSITELRESASKDTTTVVEIDLTADDSPALPCSVKDITAEVGSKLQFCMHVKKYTRDEWKVICRSSIARSARLYIVPRVDYAVPRRAVRLRLTPMLAPA